MRSRRLLVSAVALLIAGSAAAQELVPVGDPIEIRPATTTPNWGFEPRVAVSPADGSFMVVWSESTSAPFKISARRFGPGGQPLDLEPLQANTTTEHYQGYQSAVANRNGEFLVVWAGSPSGIDVFDVFGQRFDRDGARIGGQATYNQDPSGASNLSVAMAPGGDFAVGWERYFSYDIGFRRFNAAGAPLQDDALANTHTDGNQYNSAVAIDPADGTSLVAWVSQGQHSAAGGCTPLGSAPARFWNHDVVARRYDASGQPLGGEIHVSVSRDWGLRFHRPAVVGLGGGAFLVAWLDTPPCDTTAPRLIKGRIVRGDGSLGEELELSDATAAGKGWPLLMPVPGRGFLAHWYEAGRGYLVRRFDLQGTNTGPDTIVIPAPLPGEYIEGVGMATDVSGNLIVAWGRSVEVTPPEGSSYYSYHLLAQLWALPETLTPTGDDVTARPLDPATNTLPVQLTFSTVTAPGATSVTSSSEPPAPVLSGFSLGEPPVYYDVTTTAAFQGPIEVCFSYAGIAFPQGQLPCILHGENGAFVPLPSWSDPARQLVCAQTPSLSPFVLASLPVKTVGIDVKPGGWPNSINLEAAGSTPVAVLGARGFDVRAVDALSLSFAGTPALRLSNGKPMVETKDVNRDGRVDLVAYFSTRALKLGPNDATATLEGRTRDAKLIRGTDAVRVVK
jgi:hypothetical protein